MSAIDPIEEALQVNVDRGVALLDGRKPDWWHPKYIDTECVDMASDFRCILAQIYGSYSVGAWSVGLDPDEAFDGGEIAAHGFTTRFDWEPQLKALWISVITSRRESN